MLLTPKLDTTDISLWRSRKTSCRKLQSMPQLTTTISKSYHKKYNVNTIKRPWFRLKSLLLVTKINFSPPHLLTRLFLNCTSMYTSMLMGHPQLFWFLMLAENWEHVLFGQKKKLSISQLRTWYLLCLTAPSKSSWDCTWEILKVTEMRAKVGTCNFIPKI